jgi:hypothetical protein
MDLHRHMIEIADRDRLPSDHPIRLTAKILSDTLTRKGEHNFPELLIDAEANALAAYTAYTGKMFINNED